MKKKILSVVAVMALCCTVFSVSGCQQIMQATNPQALNQANDTIYFNSLESCISSVTSSLNGFEKCVKDGDVDGMKNILNDVQTSLETINNLEVPDDCKNIQQAYCDGLTQLSNVLSDYIQIYSDYKSGSIDYAVLQQRINNTQISYNNAIAKLQEADKMVAELNK